ncbi:hypothetical protein PIB30_065765 [Stylosanthes scabra]|uniref:Uncharacterized protein n=1 Tax=Stylosanthes scabra TaxID=79078 RepID=A0ABU6ZKW0_9FABA|nr:hypothetical protein [Stylosanthes scabra]
MNRRFIGERVNTVPVLERRGTSRLHRGGCRQHGPGRTASVAETIRRSIEPRSSTTTLPSTVSRTFAAKLRHTPPSQLGGHEICMNH